jgi:hypothetical protein
VKRGRNKRLFFLNLENPPPLGYNVISDKERRVRDMTNTSTIGEDVMTDYQFKTILKMVLDIAENTDDVEKIKKSLRELIGEAKQDSGEKDKPEK